MLWRKKRRSGIRANIKYLFITKTKYSLIRKSKKCVTKKKKKLIAKVIMINNIIASAI